MGTATTRGLNWSVTGKAFTIFGQEGFVLGDNWVLPTGLGIGVEVDPAPVSAEIIEIIEQDIAAGNEEKISYVGVSPSVALQLVLEGLLTEELLRAAEETIETITVTLPLGGTNRKVVILKDPKYAFATFDKYGEVV